MVAVAPLDPASDFVDLPTEVSRKSSVCAWATKLFSVWKRLQLSYFGGKYSIHRAIALDEYIRNTSLLRVVVVCVGTPLPMIVLVFTQESIPLQDPNDGWRVNYGMWIRACILVCVVIQALVLQATYIIEGFTISAWQLFLLCVAVSGGVVALAMLVADYLVFPIPFFILSMLPPFYLMLFASFRLILGRAIISHLLSKRDQVGKFAIIIAAQTIPAIIYPVYEVLFRRTEGTRSQLPVILLLPVIKVAMKNIVLRCLADMEDMAPETVIFTVDYFNAIYIATCMQSASSIAAISNITLTDFVQTAIMVYGLQRRTSDSIPTLHKVVNPAIASDSLLAILCWLCRNPQGLEKHLCDGIHQRSCLPHRISEDGQRVLNRLKTIPSITKGPHSQSIHAVIVGPKSSPHKLTIVRPDFRSTFSVWRSVRAIIPSSVMVIKQKDNEVHKALEILISTECLVVTAYLETIVPFFYCSYMLMMVHLSSAQYHTEMAHVTRENVSSTVFPVFMFGLLQIASFWVMAAVIKRNCGMRALYQLAFMLETQVVLVQSKLIFWLIVMLCFRVKHFGEYSGYISLRNDRVTHAYVSQAWISPFNPFIMDFPSFLASKYNKMKKVALRLGFLNMDFLAL